MSSSNSPFMGSIQKKPHLLTLLTLSIPLLHVLLSSSHASSVESERSLLLKLKHGLNFSRSSSQKLAGWNASTDCCEWPGIRCDSGGLGRVIGLNLSYESITGGGGLDDSMALFSLRYLEVLDLSNNYFETTIPSALASLTNLRYLNLSIAGFFGQIPASISRMTSLVSLDLSRQDDNFPGSLPLLELHKPNLALLVQNLTKLSDLRLDSVDLSAQGKEWCHVLSSSLPNLKVLTLSNCYLEGPIDPSLSKLQSLSVLRLDGIGILSSIPEFFVNFKNLTALGLSSCGLTGTFPAKILQSFSQLSYLDVSFNNFNGQIPSLDCLSKNLMHLDLSNNRFTGNLPTHWESFQKLVHVDLGDNAFNGSIPPSLFAIPSLQKIRLSYNELQGQIPMFSNVASSTLKILALSGNNLDGLIPRFVFELETLSFLALASNRFKGNVQLSWIQMHKYLIHLDLSHNNLTVDASGNNSSTMSIFPQFDTLNLASCNLKVFPELGNQSFLVNLDLSDNKINGVIPHWILESTTLQRLNLSHNNLVGFQIQYISLPALQLLDLHDNQLQGVFPSILSSSAVAHIDYSHNLLNGSIPPEIGNSFEILGFFAVSNNSLAGPIPESICNASRLLFLDLSNNHLNGAIPSCLLVKTELAVINLKGNELSGEVPNFTCDWDFMSLQVLDLSNNLLSGAIPGCLMKNTMLVVLDLRDNKLNGNIPDTFQASCSLKTLDLSNNQLQGRIPKSLNNCSALEVLNLGNNGISGVFPCLPGINSSFGVLILRNNRFHGRIWCPHILPRTWKNLQVIDLAFNNFSGPLNGKLLATWKGMTGDRKGVRNHPVTGYGSTASYENSITVTNKGLEMILVKIITIFKSIDLSSNNFDGPIPEAVGEFSSIQVLNMSHNAFTGQIPAAFGNLSNLESLDLSHNKFTGKIPKELSSLTFLAVLNLSDNHLVGTIPTGPQFQTFGNSSFGGNPDLCGQPLTKSCTSPPARQGVIVIQETSSTRINWDLLSKAFGYIFGLAVVMLPATLWPSFRIWYWPKIDHLLLRIFPNLYVKDWNNRLRTRGRKHR